MLMLESAKILVPVFQTFSFACSFLAPALEIAHLFVKTGYFTHVYSSGKTTGKLLVLSSKDEVLKEYVPFQMK